ncbi:MAG: flagellar biosynthetic protein FliQ [Planctomycetota bacterium]
MIDDSTVLIVRDTLLLVLMIAAPILGAGVVIGLLISLIQSVTSIQDQTLTFVPKIVGMVALTAAIVPWIAVRLAEFAITFFTVSL